MAEAEAIVAELQRKARNEMSVGSPTTTSYLATLAATIQPVKARKTRKGTEAINSADTTTAQKTKKGRKKAMIKATITK